MTYPGSPNGDRQFERPANRRSTFPDPLNPTPGGPLSEPVLADPLNTQADPGAPLAPPRNPLDFLAGMVPGVFYGSDPTFDAVQQAASRGGGLGAAMAMLRGGVDQARNVALQTVYRSRIGDISDAVTVATGKDLISGQELSGLDRYLFGGLGLAAVVMAPMPIFHALVGQGADALRTIDGDLYQPHAPDVPSINRSGWQDLHYPSFGQNRMTNQMVYLKAAEALTGEGSTFTIGNKTYQGRNPLVSPRPTGNTIEEMALGRITEAPGTAVVTFTPVRNVGNNNFAFSQRFLKAMQGFVTPGWDHAPDAFRVGEDNPVTRMTRRTMYRAVGMGAVNLPHHKRAAADTLAVADPGSTPDAEVAGYVAGQFALTRLDRLLEIPRAVNWHTGDLTRLDPDPDVARVGVFGHGAQSLVDGYHKFTKGQLDPASDEGQAFINDVISLEGALGFGIPIHGTLDPGFKIAGIDRNGDGDWVIDIAQDMTQHHILPQPKKPKPGEPPPPEPKRDFTLAGLSINSFLVANGHTNEALVPAITSGVMRFIQAGLEELDRIEALGILPSGRFQKRVTLESYLTEMRGGPDWYPQMQALARTIAEIEADMGMKLTPSQVAGMTSALSKRADWNEANMPALLELTRSQVLADRIARDPTTQIANRFSDTTPFVNSLRARLPEFPTDPNWDTAEMNQIMPKLVEMGGLHQAADAYNEAYPPSPGGPVPQGDGAKAIGLLNDNKARAVAASDLVTPLLAEADILGPNQIPSLRPGQVYTEGGRLTNYEDPRAARLGRQFGVIGDEDEMTRSAYMRLRKELFRRAGAKSKAAALIVPINGGAFGFDPAVIQMRNVNGQWHYKYDITGDKLRNFVTNNDPNAPIEFAAAVTQDVWQIPLGLGFRGWDTDSTANSRSYQMLAASNIIRGVLMGMEPKRAQSLEWVLVRMLKDLDANEDYHDMVHPHLQHRNNANPLGVMSTEMNDDVTLYTDTELPVLVGQQANSQKVIRIVPGRGVVVFAPVTERMARSMPNLMPTGIVAAERRGTAKGILPWVVWVKREPKPVGDAARWLNRVMSSARSVTGEAPVSGGSYYRDHRYMLHHAGQRAIRIAAAINPGVRKGEGTGLANMDEVWSRANLLDLLFAENNITAKVTVDEDGHRGRSTAIGHPREQWVDDQAEFAELDEWGQRQVMDIFYATEDLAKYDPAVIQVARDLYERATTEQGAMQFLWTPTLRAEPLRNLVSVESHDEQKHDLWIFPKTAGDADKIKQLLHSDYIETMIDKRIGFDPLAADAGDLGTDITDPYRITSNPEARLREMEGIDGEWTRKSKYYAEGKRFWNVLDVLFNEEALDYSSYDPEPDPLDIVATRIGDGMREADEHAVFDGDSHAIHYTETMRDSERRPGEDDVGMRIYPHAQPVMIGADLHNYVTSVRNYAIEEPPIPQQIEGAPGQYEWGETIQIRQVAQDVLADSYRTDPMEQLQIMLNSTAAGPFDVSVRRRDLITADMYGEPDRHWTPVEIGGRSGYWTQYDEAGVLHLYQGTNRNVTPKASVKVNGDVLKVEFHDDVPEAEHQEVFTHAVTDFLAQHPGVAFSAERIDPAQRQFLPEAATTWTREANPTHFAMWLGTGKGNQMWELAFDTDQVAQLVTDHLSDSPRRLVVGELAWSRGRVSKVRVLSGSNTGLYGRVEAALLEAGVPVEKMEFDNPATVWSQMKKAVVPWAKAVA